MKLKLAITTVVMLGLSPTAKSQYQCMPCPNGTWSPGGTRTSCRSYESSSGWSLRGYRNGQSGSITKDRTYTVYLRGGNGGGGNEGRGAAGGSGGVLQYRFTAPFSGQYYLAVGGVGQIGNNGGGGGGYGRGGVGKASHTKNYSIGPTCTKQACLWEFTG